MRKPPDQPAAAVGDRLPLGKRLGFSLLVVVFALVLLEGALALLGVKPERFESDPYVGFSSQSPLFVEETAADGSKRMVTARNKRDFFNVQQFAAKKPAGTFRIFSLGGSTAYGHPYSDTTSFNGWLREFLKATAPERKWEVINAGGISYASYREAVLMEELIRYEPDLFLVYGSHNEFLEQRLYGRVIGGSRTLRGINELARHLRFATVVKRVTASWTTDKLASAQPAQKLESEPDTILEKTLGPTSYTRNDPLRDQILHHYRFNLERMVDIAQSAGARIIFIVPAANLRDSSPFKSEHKPGLAESDLKRWKDLYDQARRSESNSPPSAMSTLSLLDQAAVIDDRMASLHFARGHVLEKLGRFSEAKAAYERARDEDVCPLRAPTAVRDIVVQVATERHAPWIAFDHLLESHAEHGLLGSSVFLDHVHPTIDGYRELALEILRTMAQERLTNPNLDPQVLKTVSQDVTNHLDSRAHSLALMNLCKTLGWAGKRREALRAGEEAVTLRPDIPEIQYEVGLAASLAGRNDEAIDHYRRALALKTNYALAHGNLAVLVEAQGQLDEAVQHYRLALQYGAPRDAVRNQQNLDEALRKLGSRGKSN
jgi:tetratricopeptide (TPR) repeat protein